MFKVVSSIGNAAYKTATKTGIAAGVEQPPYPCALPLEEFPADPLEDLAHVEKVLDHSYESIRDLLGDLALVRGVEDAAALAKNKPPKKSDWTQVDYTDSDKQGDIRLFTRPHLGPYNFARSTFTLRGVHPRTVLSCMHVQDLEARHKYSPNLVEYEVLFRNPEMPSEWFANVAGQAGALEEAETDNDHLEEMAREGIRDWHLEYNQYYAPPPVAPREFMYLCEKRYEPSEDAYYVYGCSVNYRYDMSTYQFKFDKNLKGTNRECVRGAVLFGWRLKPDYAAQCTHAEYVSCMNPNGWAPTFMVGWMKAQIGKEFTNSRRLLYLQVKAYTAYVFAGRHRAGKAIASAGGAAAESTPLTEGTEEEEDAASIATMTAASSVYLVEHEELSDVLESYAQREMSREDNRRLCDAEDEDLLPAH